MHELFATTAKGLESPLAAELSAYGAAQIEERVAGVAFRGSLEVAYRACLWSRVANRVLLPIAQFACPDADALYAGAGQVAWEDHLQAHGTLAVGFTSSRSRELAWHTRFGAQRTKDAIVDRFRQRTGSRPSVDLVRPDVRINVRVHDDQATVSIDLSGDSLHRRGWRTESGPAPLKENLAAALLLLADWPALAAAGVPLIDLMCGSGTLPIEAACIAQDRAPGLGREVGCARWLGHDAALWRRLAEEAAARARDGAARPQPPIHGWDIDARIVATARQNARRAGLADRIEWSTRALADAAAPASETTPTALVVVNPPYGERLGEKPALELLYQQLGDVLRRRFTGAQAYVLTEKELGARIGLRPRRRHTVFNGALECRIFAFEISNAKVRDEAGPGWRRPQPIALTPGAEAFANRLRKNKKHLAKWARRDGVTCYRLYDADLPEYAVAVDLYEDAAHVQEYECPPTVDPTRAETRLREVMAMVPEVLGIAPEAVFLKVRRRQRALAQYEKLDARGTEKVVREGGHQFLVNLTDYLDTGLFLDHRQVRALIGELACGRRFLNLFAYTGSATVYAAAAGARATTSVDLSNTYLDWAGRNLALNQINPRRHEQVRADVLEWLAEARGHYGLIFLAPPTFSRSKKMDGNFDLQRDHVALLRAAASRLEPDGVLLFSNHFRRFKMDSAALGDYVIEEITARTVPPDFRRQSRVHNCWRIQVR